MPLLANVLLTTGRGTYNAGTGITSPDTTTNLTAVRAALQPAKQMKFMLADGVLETDYTASVDTGTDIVAGDTILSITLLDGVTPWPESGGSGTSGNMLWRVAFVREDASGFLPERVAYIARSRGGGPATITP